ncbi:SAM-dependent methyltransferase [Streptomyces olivochromogenes]|uniref:SAM-dependent methyltransferase n=1 Tax=Streptomyces olivochromogenes TaxID=1963 RepID=UPI00368F1C38
MVLAHARAPPTGTPEDATDHLDGEGGEGHVAGMRFRNENATLPITVRDRVEITAFCEGLDLLGPGLVSCARWRARPGAGDALLARPCGAT